MLWNDFLGRVSDLSSEEFLQQFKHPFLLATAPFSESIAPNINSTGFNEKTRLSLSTKASKLADTHVILLTSNKIRIGRELSCNIIFSNPKISREHLILSFLGSGTWILQDCCSHNGTYLNGAKVSGGLPYLLEDGAIIDLGPEVSLIFKTPIAIWKTVDMFRARLEMSSCG